MSLWKRLFGSGVSDTSKSGSLVNQQDRSPYQSWSNDDLIRASTTDRQDYRSEAMTMIEAELKRRGASLEHQESDEEQIALSPEHYDLVLPTVMEDYLHRNFGESTSPTPGKGGEKYDEFIPAWNEGDYETSYKLLIEAIELGLEVIDESSAHCYLGQIYIKKCQLDKTIDEFLKSLQASTRAPDDTWETAMRLYYIYSEAGESASAYMFLSLAEDSNLKLQWPRKHAEMVETEVRALTRQHLIKSLSLSEFPNSMELLYKEINDFTYPLMLSVCLPRGIDTTEVASLFDASCPGCSAILNTTSVMQIGDIQQSAAKTVTPIPEKCPQCGMNRITVRFMKLSDDEKETLQSNEYFSKLSWFSQK